MSPDAVIVGTLWCPVGGGQPGAEPETHLPTRRPAGAGTGDGSVGKDRPSAASCRLPGRKQGSTLISIPGELKTPMEKQKLENVDVRQLHECGAQTKFLHETLQKV